VAASTKNAAALPVGALIALPKSTFQTISAPAKVISYADLHPHGQGRGTPGAYADRQDREPRLHRPSKPTKKGDL
jgi:hypothetical protein